MTKKEYILSMDDHITQRREKLNKLRENGNAYPNNFRRDNLIHDLIVLYKKEETSFFENKCINVKIAGRIMSKRIMGKASFIHIQDMSGKLQIYIKKDELSEDIYNNFLTWDLGDIVGISGFIFKTKTSELSVRANKIFLLTKSLLPIPEKFHGLVDQETRYRQRYLDLIANPETRKIFKMRSQLITSIRNFFANYGFLEVETPMMHVIPGGATARPFITYHNALDMQLYLRIAPELYLKQLVVGGFEKVFEINRNFRNEGISLRHNPEFTMLEFYLAYADYKDLMELTEDLLKYLSLQIFGTQIIKNQDLELDFSKPFRKITLRDSIKFYNPYISDEQLIDIVQIRKIAESFGIHTEKTYGLGRIQCEIFEKTVEKKLIEPTFITAYPVEVSPLARINDEDKLVTDRFEFFVNGRELANGFSELNDPDDQAQRFRKQAEELANGNNEAMHYDGDYIKALEYGLPPTAGEGIGIDRLVMLFTGVASIRDVILFPLLRTL